MLPWQACRVSARAFRRIGWKAAGDTPGNVSCFIVERLFERFDTGNRMQSTAKCLSATEMRLDRTWCRDSNLPSCSWIRGAMRSSASSSCSPWLRNPRGGAVCNLQGSKACFSILMKRHTVAAQRGRRRSLTSMAAGSPWRCHLLGAARNQEQTNTRLAARPLGTSPLAMMA
jgi:hypothetical protein